MFHGRPTTKNKSRAACDSEAPELSQTHSLGTTGDLHFGVEDKIVAEKLSQLVNDVSNKSSDFVPNEVHADGCRLSFGRFSTFSSENSEVVAFSLYTSNFQLGDYD